MLVVSSTGSALPTLPSPWSSLVDSASEVAVMEAEAAMGAAAVVAVVAAAEAAAVVPWRFRKSWGDSSFCAR